MALSFSDSELAAYLEEDLDAERASALEQALPGDELLLQRLQTIRQQNDSGEHTLGSIWRQQGLSCPSRKTLGAYLLGILPQEQALFIRSHIEIRRCTTCRADVEDLQQQQTQNQETKAARTTKYYQSSIGYFSQRQNEMDS